MIEAQDLRCFKALLTWPGSAGRGKFSSTMLFVFEVTGSFGVEFLLLATALLAVSSWIADDTEDSVLDVDEKESLLEERAVVVEFEFPGDTNAGL